MMVSCIICVFSLLCFFVQVRHIFAQLVKCTENLHSVGRIHGDIKPLNIVRINSQWMLIDMDASCAIGVDPTGAKYSSAYIPPEAVVVDSSVGFAAVRSQTHLAMSASTFYPTSTSSSTTAGDLRYDLLIADASFDVWSLGCVLYNLCTATPLFKESPEDCLSTDPTDIDDIDSLWSLAEWSESTKLQKLKKVSDPLARNLLSQILTKNVAQRPSISRILAHPFLSGKSVARLVGSAAEFDTFLSYRVASDAQHVEKLYHLLTDMGLKVWWDKLCLEPGVPWKEGFCAGLVNSRTFVCLLSREAINSPSKDRQNFSKLTEDSNCDNVFLEHRLALELRGLGLIEKIFPVMIGDFDIVTGKYGKYFDTGCLPRCADVVVKSVEADLRTHMDNQGLGSPLETALGVSSVLFRLTECQGGKVEGEGEAAFLLIANSIFKMVADCRSGEVPSVHSIQSVGPATASPAGGLHSISSPLCVHQPNSAQSVVGDHSALDQLTTAQQEVILLRAKLASLGILSV